MQDGTPGWTRLGCLPSPLSLPHPHSPSTYSGAAFPRNKPSPTGLSRQGFLPLLQLHPNYSLLPRQGHANHCYLGCITTPIPEQRQVIPLPDLNCSTLPFPLTPHSHGSENPCPGQGVAEEGREQGWLCSCCHSSPCQLSSCEPAE